jgi:hypothetical protein
VPKGKTIQFSEQWLEQHNWVGVSKTNKRLWLEMDDVRYLETSDLDKDKKYKVIEDGRLIDARNTKYNTTKHNISGISL